MFYSTMLDQQEYVVIFLDENGFVMKEEHVVGGVKAVARMLNGKLDGVPEVDVMTVEDYNELKGLNWYEHSRKDC